MGALLRNNVVQVVSARDGGLRADGRRATDARRTNDGVRALALPPSVEEGLRKEVEALAADPTTRAVRMRRERKKR